MSLSSDSGVVVNHENDDTISIMTTCTEDLEFLDRGGAVDSNAIAFSENHHGKHVIIAKNGRAAMRKKGTKDAVVLSNRPLNDNELFEVELIGKKRSSKTKKIVTGNSGKGSLRIGVTAHRPENVWPDIPQSMKLMSSDTWMMKDDIILEGGKPLLTLHKVNLKNLQEGDRLGTMRVPEFGGSLIIFINGMSIGVMATGLPEELYGFVELRGDSDRVAITENSTVEEDAMPIQIREMRWKDDSIKDLHEQLDEKRDQIEELDHRIAAQGDRIIQLQEALKAAQPKDKKRVAETQTRQQSLSPKPVIREEIDLAVMGDTDESETKEQPKKEKTTACCTIL